MVVLIFLSTEVAELEANLPSKYTQKHLHCSNDVTPYTLFPVRFILANISESVSAE